MATKKRIAIFSQGSRGDVQPYIALALGLAYRGHEVTLAAPNDFEDWIRSFGLTYAPMGSNMRDLLNSPDIQQILAGNPLGIRRVWKSIAVPMLEESLKTIWEVGRNADILIHHPKVVGPADVAEVTGAPVVLASPVPMFPTSDFPIITMTHDLGNALNRLTWLPLRWMRGFYSQHLSRWRKQVLGLSQRYRPKSGTDPFYGANLRLIGVSEKVMQRPSDWDSKTIMTGYWRLPSDADWHPDDKLGTFLEAGEAPVYLGFGSMPVAKPEQTTRTIVEAVEAAKCRAVLSAGWAGLGEPTLPENLTAIKDTPHDRLFPLMSGVVHHGGAGTTAAGLTAGCPTLICPAGVDQPFWAARVVELGCGPLPLRLNKLSVGALTERLSELRQSPAFAVNASALGKELSEEDGVTVAIDLIERHFCH